MIDVFNQVFCVSQDHVEGCWHRRLQRAVCFSDPTQIWKIPCHLVQEPDQPSSVWIMLCPEPESCLAIIFIKRKTNIQHPERECTSTTCLGSKVRTLTTAGNFSLPLVPVLGPEVSFGQHLSWRKSATRQQPECHQASRKAFPSHFSWLCFDTTSALAVEWENSICICIYFHLVLMSKHAAAVAATAKLLQSCLTCNPIDGSPPGSPVPGILQAGTLEWVAISFSNAWKWKWKWSRSVVSNS